ncbi:MAG: hypothetical protein ACSHX5_11240 [Phycisphaerales bacterium]
MNAASVITLCVLSGTAVASPTSLDEHLNPNTPVTTAGFSSASITIDLSGMNSWDLQGDIDNESTDLFLGGGYIFAIGWDVQIQTIGSSWLSEVTINLDDELFITPGIGDDFAGTMSYSSGGMINLIDLGKDFFVNGDGILSLEIFESFDDVPDAIDAVFGPGSKFYIQTVLTPPTPGTAGVLAIAGLVASRRRRA